MGRGGAGRVHGACDGCGSTNGRETCGGERRARRGGRLVEVGVTGSGGQGFFQTTQTVLDEFELYAQLVDLIGLGGDGAHLSSQDVDVERGGGGVVGTWGKVRFGAQVAHGLGQMGEFVAETGNGGFDLFHVLAVAVEHSGVMRDAFFQAGEVKFVVGVTGGGGCGGDMVAGVRGVRRGHCGWYVGVVWVLCDYCAGIVWVLCESCVSLVPSLVLWSLVESCGASVWMFWWSIIVCV